MITYPKMNDKKIRRQRYLVIELTVQVEEILSMTLGNLLDINWKKSKTLGYGSTALSFNQKIMIIQDIKGIDNLTKEKLDALMYIRNKFAHVKEVNSFESFFSISKNATRIKRKLQSWYHKETDNFVDAEGENVNYFIRLVSDSQNFLIEISKEHIKKKGYEKGRKEATDRINEELIAEIKNTVGGIEKLDEIWEKLKKEFNEEK